MVTHSMIKGAALLGLLVAASCAGETSALRETAEDDVAEADRYGGTAVLGWNESMADLNPATTTSVGYRWISMQMLFMALVERREDLELHPYLARSWELNPDSTVLTFHLRDDVHWHDGVKTTAWDVKFSYDLHRDARTAVSNVELVPMPPLYGDGEVVDSFTFRVALTPHPDFLEPWATTPPLPRHVLQHVAPEELRRHAFSTRAPLGNGPFRFVSHEPGQSWTFEANERFPPELGGRPYLDRIIYRLIPESTTRLTELLTGGVHYIPTDPSQREQIEDWGGARVLAYRPVNFSYIGWNTRRDLFKDARVRRALTKAIDRQGIIEGILYGEADPANASVAPFLWHYDALAGADLVYDTTAAKALLTEAGWRDRDGNGVIEDSTGREFRFAVLTNRSSDTNADIVEKVASDLARVGIVAEVRLLEGGAVGAQVHSTSRDFDALFTSLTQPPYASLPKALFHCNYQDYPMHYSGICDAELDALIDSLTITLDRSAARPLWQRYQRRLAELQPLTFVAFPHRLVGVSNSLQDVQPDTRGPFGGARSWWLAPDARRTGSNAVRSQAR